MNMNSYNNYGGNSDAGSYSSCSFEGYYQNYDSNPSELSFQQNFHSCEQPGIITSDNGLSYTNLDTYQPYPRRREKADEKTWYGEEVGHFVQCEFDSWNIHYMKEEYNGDGWPSGGVPGAGGGGPDTLYGSSAPPRHRLQQTGKPVPTYKWMQVKRNVPKPTGKWNVGYSFFDFLSYVESVRILILVTTIIGIWVVT